MPSPAPSGGPVDPASRLVLRRLGLRDYAPVWRSMQRFTDARAADTPDELWVLQHLPVFTLGQAGREEHLLAPGDIPVLHVDRGGQVTYHGPGQIVAYPLLDLRRRGLGVRDLVSRIEQSVIDVLAEYGVQGQPRAGAPGVYAGDAKIAALGLRVRRGCSFHGLSFNVHMDLSPFQRINPCGYRDLEVTQLSEFVRVDFARVEEQLVQSLCRALGYNGGLVGGPGELP